MDRDAVRNPASVPILLPLEMHCLGGEFRIGHLPDDAERLRFGSAHAYKGDRGRMLPPLRLSRKRIWRYDSAQRGPTALLRWNHSLRSLRARHWRGRARARAGGNRLHPLHPPERVPGHVRRDRENREDGDRSGETHPPQPRTGGIRRVGPAHAGDDPGAHRPPRLHAARDRRPRTVRGGAREQGIRHGLASRDQRIAGYLPQHEHRLHRVGGRHRLPLSRRGLRIYDRLPTLRQFPLPRSGD